MIYLGLALFFGVMVGILSRTVLGGIISFLLNLYLSWQFLPVLNYGFYGLGGLFLMNCILIFIFDALGPGDGDGVTSIGATGGIIVGVIALLMLVILPLLTSWSLLHAKSYRNLIGTVSEGIYSTDTTPVDISQVRTVDQAYAMRLADKRLGEDPGLGSQVDVGTLSIQLVGDQLYWVGPLNHSGFFRWWANSNGTPGYIMVSATNDQDVKLVREVNKLSLNIQYNDGAFFNDYLPRHLYANGYASTGLADYTFEIDDQGNPFWVVTKYKKTVGFAGEDAVGVVVVNAQYGDIKEYTIADAPAWIDRIQPEDFIDTQLNDWGHFVHGWLNPSQEDRLRVTPGMSLVYGNDGQAYWYTGMTSVGADEGTIGFILVNTRTKIAKIYNQAGATEIAAMRSAEGAVQEKRYNATFPILYNIGGVPTYFMTLKDDSGLVKLYAWVSVENYQIFGVGPTLQQSVRAYSRTLLDRGNEIAPDGAVQRFEVSAQVLRVAKEPTGDGTVYYYMLEGYENKVFTTSSGLSPEVIITQVGDFVKLTFNEGGNPIVDIATFDNLGIELQKTQEQLGVETRAEEVRERKFSERIEQNADAAWENLTPEQKKALLEANK